MFFIFLQNGHARKEIYKQLGLLFIAECVQRNRKASTQKTVSFEMAYLDISRLLNIPV